MSRRIAVFIFFAYTISWLVWATPALNATLGLEWSVSPWFHIAGGLGPMLGALLAALVLDGPAGLANFVRTRFRITTPAWVVMGLGLPVVFFLVAGLVLLALGRGFPDLADLGLNTKVPLTAPPMIWAMWTVFYGLGEETGWRGFLLPELAKRIPARQATLLVASMWAPWHFPVFFYDKDLGSMGPLGTVGWVVGLIFGSLLLGWLTINANSSLWPAVLWHGTFNFFATGDRADGLLPALQSAQLIAFVLWVARRYGRELTGELASVSTVTQRLRALVEDALHGRSRCTHAVLRIDGPPLGLESTLVAGVAHEHTGEPFTPETPFIAASVGKLAVAAAVLSLARAGKLALTDSVATYVRGQDLERLPHGFRAGDVTIVMLLSHTSGLPDYFEGRSKDGAPPVLQIALAEPDRVWTTRDLLDYCGAHYAMASAPGEAFLYTDANYDLLGLILEAATGKPFHEVVRERVLEPAGLRHTWYHALEVAPDGVRYADVFYGGVNVAHTPTMSLDLAGGGLATTAEDLGRLMRWLLAGTRVGLDDVGATWTADALSRGIDYGFGLWRLRPARLTFGLVRAPELLGASGSNGSWVYYVPAWDVVISGTFDSGDFAKRHIAFLMKVMAVVSARIPEVPARSGERPRQGRGA